MALVALLLGGCSNRASRLDPSLASLVPSDTLALADIRLDQLRATLFYRKLDETNLLPGPKQLRAQTDELLLASDGRNNVIIARGHFSGTVPGFTMLTGNIAVAGAPVDRFKSGGAPADLVGRIERLPEGQIVAVSNGWRGFTEAAARDMGNAVNLNRVLQSVETAGLTVDFRVGLHAAATGDCKTEQGAQSLSESLRGLLGMARLSLSPKQPDLLHAVDAIRVQQAGRSIQVHVDLPPQQAGELIDALAGR